MLKANKTFSLYKRKSYYKVKGYKIELCKSAVNNIFNITSKNIEITTKLNSKSTKTFYKIILGEYEEVLSPITIITPTGDAITEYMFNYSFRNIKNLLKTNVFWIKIKSI